MIYCLQWWDIEDQLNFFHPTRDILTGINEKNKKNANSSGTTGLLFLYRFLMPLDQFLFILLHLSHQETTTWIVVQKYLFLSFSHHKEEIIEKSQWECINKGETKNRNVWCYDVIRNYASIIIDCIFPITGCSIRTAKYWQKS